jgi:hypothetical protein
MNKLQIKKLGVLSVAKMYAVLGFVMGLIIGIMYLIFGLIFGAMMMGMAGRNGAAAGGFSVLWGIVGLIFFPIFYSIVSFVAGAIGALIYNLCAGFIGGIEIEVENVY